MSRRYLTAVALLAMFAVAFGVLGTVAPPLAEEGTPVQPQQESSSVPIGHFQNPPSYDSGWVDVRDKRGQYATLRHDLNTTDLVVDVVGKQSLEVACGAVAWKRTYGGAGYDYAYRSLVRTSDGGYAVAGHTGSYGAGADDFWLVKTDSAGTMQWNKTYGGADDDIAYSLIQTDDGGYALAGYTNSYGAGNSDLWLVKTDSAGTMQWSQTYGGANADNANSLVQTSDGGYALAGSTNSFGAGSFDAYLVKTDSTGTMQWSETYGGVGLDWAISLIQTGDGGYALAGDTGSYGAGLGDFWLIKTDLDGMAQWNRTYGGTGADSAQYVIQTYDGGYALAGSTTSYGAGSSDSWLVKTDSDGIAQWNRTYGGTVGEVALCMTQTFDGGYALAGATSSFGAGGWDFWLVKVDFLGIPVWNKTYGGAGTDRAYALRQTGDGSYILAGYTTSSGAGGSDFWLIKVKPELGLEHQRNLGGISIIPGWKRSYGGAGSDLAFSMILTGDGGFALTGSTNSYGAGGYDFWLVKTDSAGTMLWSKTYGGISNEHAHCVVQTVDGGYAIAGSTTSYGAGQGDFWLVKTDSAGTMLWSKTYGGTGDDSAESVVQTDDGGFALAGDKGFGGGNWDFWLVKTDSAGNHQWNKTYGGAASDSAYSMVQTVDGGYALAGRTTSYGAGLWDFWLVKTDSAGNHQWNKTYGGAGEDYCHSVIQAGDGSYALAGSTGSFGAGNSDSWLVVADSAGNMQWNKTYGGADDDIAYSLIQTDDGGYAIAGSTESFGPGDDDFWLVVTDEGGNVLWSQTHGGADDDIAKSLVQTDDGGYAIAGYHDLGGIPNSWMVKVDLETGLTTIALTNSAVALYRGETDSYWNYVRVRIWLIKEPSWIYGDINMDGIVDVEDLYIVGRNYGKTFSLLSLSGIVGILGIQTVKKRRQSKQPR